MPPEDDPWGVGSIRPVAKPANTPSRGGVLSRHIGDQVDRNVANLLAFCIDQLGGSLVLDAVEVENITNSTWEIEVLEQTDPYRVIYKVKEVK